MSESSGTADSGAAGGPAAGKGRPTPKRSEAQRRRGPVAPPPATRKEAAQRLRAEAAADRQRLRTGTRSGDERNLLARDAGPVRRLVRDLVDSRRSVGVLLLPLLVLVFGTQLTRNAALFHGAILLWYAVLLVVAVDLLFAGLRLHKRLRAQFPQESALGRHIGYGLMRSTQFRRFRMPPCRVSVGDRV